MILSHSIEVNSKIKKFSSSFKLHEKSNIHKFKSSKFMKKSSRNKIKKIYRTNPTKDDTESQIPSENDSPSTKRKKLSSFFERLSKNSATKDMELVQGKVNPGCVKMFNKPYFQDFLDTKDLCTDAEIKSLSSLKSRVSLIIGDDLKLIFINDKEKYLPKLVFSDTKRVNVFPFESKHFQTYLKIEVVREGQVVLTYQKLNRNTYKIIDKNMNGKELYTNFIGSVVLGKNTYAQVNFRFKPKVQLANDSKYLDLWIDEYSSVEVFKIGDIKIPSSAPNCIMIFKMPYFESPPNTDPDTFCEYLTDLKEDNLKNQYSKKEKPDEKEKSDQEDKKMENLDQISKDFKKSMKSILIGSNITAVLFVKPFLEGNALHIKERMLSFEMPLFNENTESIMLLNPGCYVVFSGDEYKGINHKFCVSINSVDKATWNTDLRSIIVGKNTILEIYSGENYTGKSVRLKSSTEYIYLHGVDFPKSIKVIYPSVRSVDLTSKDFNNRGCLLFFEKQNYDGKSKLHCDEKHLNPNPIYKREFRSVKISKGDDMIIYYEKAFWNIFNVDRTIHLFNSTPQLSIDDDAKFLRYSVLKEGCVMFFDEVDYKGNYQNICEDSSDLSAEPNSLSSYRSVLIGENTSITMHDLINYNTTVGNSPFKAVKSVNNFETSNQSRLVGKLSSVEFGMSDNPQKVSYIPNTGFSITNLFLGIFLGLFSEDFTESGKAESERNKFMTCIPSQLSKEVKTSDSNNVETSVVEFKDSHKGFFSSLMDNAGSVIRAFIKWYCNFKDKMFGYIEKLLEALGLIEAGKEELETVNDENDDEYSLKSLKKGIGESMIEFADNQLKSLDEKEKKEADEATKLAKEQELSQKSKTSRKKYKKRRSDKYSTPTRRKFRVHYQTKGNFFMDLIVKFKNWIVEQSKAFFKKYIMDPFIKIKNNIVGFIKKFLNFFQTRWILYAIKAIGCATVGTYQIIDKVKAFIGNIKVLITGITTAVGGFGIFILIDLLLAQLCQIKYFRLAVNYFALGNKWNDDNKEGKDKTIAYSYYGLGVGTFFNAIASATTFTTAITDIIESKKNISGKSKNKLKLY